MRGTVKRLNRFHVTDTIGSINQFYIGDLAALLTVFDTKRSQFDYLSRDRAICATSIYTLPILFIGKTHRLIEFQMALVL